MTKTHRFPNAGNEYPWRNSPLLGNDAFATWIRSTEHIDIIARPLRSLDWNTIYSPLDVESFICGRLSALYRRRAGLGNFILNTVFRPNDQIQVVWWRDGLVPGEGLLGPKFFPVRMLQERHLEFFLRGIFWQKEDVGLPSIMFDDCLALVLCLSAKQPPRAFSEDLFSLSNKNYLLRGESLILSGHEPYGSEKLLLLSDRNLLGSPWISKEDRDSITSKMRPSAMCGIMVCVVSSTIIAKKVSRLCRTKGNAKWIFRLMGGPAVVDDDSMLSLLPSITQPIWFEAVRAMLGHRSLFEKKIQKACTSILDCPRVILSSLGGRLL